jgi:hypothetical protein
MAAQSDFAKHGAVALSEVAAFGGFLSGKAVPVHYVFAVGWERPLPTAVQKGGNHPSGNHFVSHADSEEGDAVSRLYDIVVATAACTF